MAEKSIDQRLDEVLAELEARPHPERAIACPYCKALPDHRCVLDEFFQDDPEMFVPLSHTSRIKAWEVKTNE